jgi:cytochrome bd-type quinol oxidase subunit 1
MTDYALWHRIQFAFTITYHYIFPLVDDGVGPATGGHEGLGRMEERRALQSIEARH